MAKRVVKVLGLLPIAVAVATTLEAATVCTRPPNLVANGGFERGPWLPGSLPDRWSFDSYADTAVPLWDYTTAHSGRRSVKISSTTPDDAFWTQNVPVEPATPYFLSAWIKTQDVAHTDQVVDLGANVSLFGGFTSSPGALGTRDWARSSLSFRTGLETQVTVAARLGFFAGTTTGTAWFDDVELRRGVPQNPHPRWDILVLIYGRTEIAENDASGLPHRFVASMTEAEKRQAGDAARQFVAEDIPALTSGNMLPRVSIRYPERALTRLSKLGTGWWPSPADTALERDPSFDSVIVIWDPRATDATTGQPVWIGTAAGLTPSMGTGQAYASLIIEAATSYGHRNVFKHEWGHSILEYFAATGTTPTPKVENHAVAGQYVACGTGAQYVWADESDTNPIPNSIYSNQAGFTHDYYSGTVALASDPGRCLGIGSDAWAWGGPVSHSGTEPVFTSNQRINAMILQVHALASSGLLDRRYGDWLRGQLQIAAWADARGYERVAELALQRFVRDSAWLSQRGTLTANVANLLREAASQAAECL
jgi:hypothetical protein